MKKSSLIIFTSVLAINYTLAAQTLKDIPPNQYISDFVSTNSATNNTNLKKLSDLLNKKGFLKGSSNAINAQDTISNTKNALNKLPPFADPVQNQLNIVDQNLADFALYYQLLENATPPNYPPFNCYNVKTGTKGIVTKKSGSRTFTFFVSENESYDFIDDINDVGLMGSGAEYIVSPTPPPKTQMAHINESRKVDCLSHPQ